MEINDKDMLYKVATQLELWAEQSLSGGWSTHQVKPMKKLAEQIHLHLTR